MRMLLHVKVPHESFNAAVKEGTAGKKIRRILDELKPQAVYFTEYGGRRSAIMIIDVDDPSKVRRWRSPGFSPSTRIVSHVVMTPEDLARAGLDEPRAGLDEPGKKWA